MTAAKVENVKKYPALEESLRVPLSMTSRFILWAQAKRFIRKDYIMSPVCRIYEALVSYIGSFV